MRRRRLIQSAPSPGWYLAWPVTELVQTPPRNLHNNSHSHGEGGQGEHLIQSDPPLQMEISLTAKAKVKQKVSCSAIEHIIQLHILVTNLTEDGEKSR